jgi:hypothetical protein
MGQPYHLIYTHSVLHLLIVIKLTLTRQDILIHQLLPIRTLAERLFEPRFRRLSDGRGRRFIRGRLSRVRFSRHGLY